MAGKKIIIDGYIGPYGFSKQYIRYLLSDALNQEVTVDLSSLGGSVDHALNIHQQFIDHGNVTVRLIGFNASSATIVALGAKKVEMSENSLYLIHKVMSWVDAFGYKNGDDLDELIKKLEKEKKENEKVDVVIAKMYVAKTGKSIAEILDLMKQNTWITAEEAKTWGFVDSTFTPAEKVNYMDDMKLVAMIDAAGYPTPKRDTNLNNKMKTDEQKDSKTLLASIKDQVNNLLSILSGEKTDEKKDEKKDEKAPTLEDQVKDLTNQVKLISEKVNGKQEEKKDEKADGKEKSDEKSDKKDEKSDEKEKTALVKEIENLKNQIDILAKSEAQDKDLNKETDGKTAEKDDLHASIARAREFKDAYEL